MAKATTAVALAPTAPDARRPMAELKQLGFTSSWTMAGIRWLKRGATWYPDMNGNPFTEVSISPTTSSKRSWVLVNQGVVIGQTSKVDQLAPLYDGNPPTDEQRQAHEAAVAQQKKLAEDLAAKDATKTAETSGDDTKTDGKAPAKSGSTKSNKSAKSGK